MHRPPGSPGPSLFASPHFDDVVLSCGATVATLVGSEPPPLVVTVFAGETTDEAISDFARWKHERWDKESIDHVIASRRDEEAAAAAAMGYTSIALGFPDAIYRGDRYGHDAELYAAPREQELGLVNLVADELAALVDDDALVYVPLAAGDHVDHQIAFEAGARLAAQGRTVYAFEDSPYALHSPAKVDDRLARLSARLGPPEVVSVGDAIEGRLDGIACYTSQLPVIFRFTDDWRGAVRAHAKALGRGEPAERFWRILA